MLCVQTMINTQKIHPLTEFLRNSKAFTDRIDLEKEPVGLTVNGKVKLVLMDSETFEKLSAIQDQQRLIEAIREGELAIKEGRFRPAEEAFADLNAKHGL